jgi:hypothetical protein
MQQRRNLFFEGTAAALLLGISAGCTGAAQDSQVPTFEVNPVWPQPLEYPFILGPVSGVTVAPDGNVIILTRQDGFNQGNEINSVTGTGSCCTPAPAVTEYAPDGRIVRQWGGPGDGYQWPQRPHGIAIDPEGNIWIGGGVVSGGGGGGRPGAAPAAPPIDSHILKFSREGRFLATIGEPGVGTAPNQHSATSFGGAARFSFDADENEVYVADGYANRRVAVLDMTTGALKRQWGANGNAPDNSEIPAYANGGPSAAQFREVTCAELSNDGLVYVCDRASDRIQVFKKDGTFVKEATVAPATLALGSVWDIAFSPDKNQRFIYVADGMNEHVRILDRETLTERTNFGIGGRVPSTFLELGSIAVNAQGDIFTAENGGGRRVQKFTNTGFGEVSGDQGAVWPSTAPVAAAN